VHEKNDQPAVAMTHVMVVVKSVLRIRAAHGTGDPAADVLPRSEL
jgi:hypothetical protein